MLVLVTLRNDPEHGGLLCFEDPENNVHPSRLKGMTEILQDLATDFSDPRPVRTAPAPGDLATPIRPSSSATRIFCPTFSSPHLASRTEPEDTSQLHHVTRIVPVIPDPVQPLLPIPEEVQSYTLSEVQNYLESADLGAARRHLGAQLARDNGRPFAEDKADLAS